MGSWRLSTRRGRWRRARRCTRTFRRVRHGCGSTARITAASRGGGPSYRFSFRTAGRPLLILAKLGATASGRVRNDLTVALNSLRFASLSKRERAIRLPGAPTDVTYRDGAVWTTTEGPASGSGLLVRIDPATGHINKRISLPNLTDYSHIAVAYGNVWITDTGSGDVYRVSEATEKLTATIHLGGSPLGITTGAGSVWVTAPGPNPRSQAGLVYRINPASNRVVARLKTSDGIGPIAYAGGSVWLINTSGPGQHLQRINPATNRFSGRVPLYPNATSVQAIAGAGRYLWLGDRRWLVSRLDTGNGKLVKGFSAGGNAIGAYKSVAFSVGPAGGGSNRSIATQLDAVRGEAAPTYLVGRTPVAVSVGINTAWVANFQDATLTRIAYG